MLAAGSLIYLVTTWLFAGTGNPNLAPMAILLGAFVAPVAYITYLYESDALYDVPPPTVALTFLSGGLFGVLAAQLIEPRVSALHVGGILAVAVSEELAKPLGVFWLARHGEFRTARHGLLLGAAAGMGFAAFETMGYAFQVLVGSGGDSQQLTRVLLTRGLLSPLAHATWTALIVGAFWREGRRLTPTAGIAFAAAVLLHVAWNWSANAIPVDLVLPGFILHWRSTDLAVPELSLPLPGLIIGAFGIWLLRRASRQPAAT